jgi:hypothetical protein
MLAPMPGAARRPRGVLRLALVASCTLVATSCGGVGQPAPYDATGVDGLVIPTPSPDPADFRDEVDNPWFPLRPGDTKRYVVEEAGDQVGTVRTEVLGLSRVAGLDATAVRTTTRLDGREQPVVTRYFAQDEAGNVWLVGEDSTEREWRAAEDGAEAGLAMPAEPRIGDGWVRARVPGTDEQTVLVVEPGVAPSDGVTPDTVWTIEDDGIRTRNVYAADLGLVESVVIDGGRITTLVEPRPG